MKKLKNILKEIGFRDRMDKEVDDESKAEFQDFGEYVAETVLGASERAGVVSLN
jgi:hypothetical protein